MTQIKLDTEVSRKAIKLAIEELVRYAVNETHAGFAGKKPAEERTEAIAAHLNRTRDAVIHLANLGSEGIRT